jgi:lipopolysaccharide transport system permease protein
MVMLLLGTLTWQWFESAVTLGSQGIKTKLHIMMHFPLPKCLFPLVGVLISTWKFLCIFAVLLVFCALAGFPPNACYLYLPLVLGTQLILIIGLAIPLAIGVAYFNDLLTVSTSLFRLMMILSGAVFEADKVPPAALKYFYANPMAGLIESYRDIVLHNSPPSLALLAYALAWGLGLGALGLLWSRRIDGSILKSVNFNA